MAVIPHPGSEHAIAASAGEVGELYAALARRLEQIVRLDVRATDAVIEDACQIAWSRLLVHAERVSRDAVLSWLVTTAVREAWRQVRHRDRDLSLEAALEDRGEEAVASGAPGADIVVEQRQRLDAVSALPERQRRLLWLHALGLSYAEISLYTGDTHRTVERQLLRAKNRIREAAADSGAEP